MATSSKHSHQTLLPLLDSRDGVGSTDSKLINGYFTKDEHGEVWVRKRPAFVDNTTYSDTYIAGKTPLGIFWWEGWGPYTVSSSGGTVTVRWMDMSGVGPYFWQTAGTFTASAAPTGNPQFWFNTTGTTTNYMYLSNGSVGYTIKNNGTGSFTFAKITDVNYPPNQTPAVPLVPGSAFLDGTLYVMDYKARIWGSANLYDPTTWGSTNMIPAQIEPDGGVAIAKQASYVVAFKQWTTEFFYDAANPTGSPLLPVTNAKLPMGCAAPYSVQSINDVLYFIGANKSIGPAVYRIVGLQLSKVSTPAIEKALEYAVYNTGSLVGNVTSFQIRDSAHTFYGIETPNGTFVYDIELNQWVQWNINVNSAKDSGNNLNIVSGTSSAAFQMALFQYGTNAQYMASFEHDQVGYGQLKGYYDSLAGGYSPSTMPVTLDAIAPNFDGGTRLKKMLTKMLLHVDQKNGGTLQIRWSDDDYQTWSNWVSVNLQSDIPMLTQLGTFRRRAFQFRHQSASPFRMRSPELELHVGKT